MLSTFIKYKIYKWHTRGTDRPTSRDASHLKINSNYLSGDDDDDSAKQIYDQLQWMYHRRGAVVMWILTHVNM